MVAYFLTIEMGFNENMNWILVILLDIKKKWIIGLCISISKKCF